MHWIDRGQGPALVLLHAFGTDKRLWAPQVAAFAPRYCVLATDLRGFGESGATDGSAVFMDAYADDVIALMDKLRIERAAFVGISLGGYIALSLALRYPARTGALVLANSRASGDDEQGKAARQSLVAAIEKDGARAVVNVYGERLFGPKASSEVRNRVREMMISQAPSSLISATRGMAVRPDRRPELGRIAAPTLVVTGSADILILPAISQELQRGIAKSVYVEIPDAGHLSSIDLPEAFNAAVANFLSAISF